MTYYYIIVILYLRPQNTAKNLKTMSALLKNQITNKAVLSRESRELVATATNRLGFLVAVVGKGLRNKEISTCDVLFLGLNKEQTEFTVRTKYGENCYSYQQFHDAISWAKGYLGYQETSDDYVNV